MKNKSLIILAIVITLLLTSGVVLAANEDPDYRAGYVAAQEFYADSTIEYDYMFAFYIYLNQGRIDEEILINYARRIQYEEGFRQGYKDAMEGAPLDVNYSVEIGRSLGEQYAIRDYYNNLTNSFSRAMPSDSAIVFRYNLGKMPVSYREEFMAEFKVAFQEGYTDKYEELLLQPKLDSYQSGLEDGSSIGDTIGRIFAQRDIEIGQSFNTTRNLKSDSVIISQYNLTVQASVAPEYIDAFVQGYKSGYQTGYTEEFRSLKLEKDIGQIEFFTISPAGTDIVISNGKIAMSFLPGTFYKDANIIIENKHYSSYNTRQFNEVSDVYEITLSNPAATRDLSKYVKISMPFYHTAYKAGIYKLVEGKFQYMPSFKEGDTIYTLVRVDTLESKTSTFVLLEDPSFIYVKDINANWAKPEIETMIKRGIITGYTDGTFKPSNNITRAEFLTLLSRINSWVLPSVATTEFNDHSTFGMYDKIIGYAYKMRYIIGYPDGSFKPSNNITYREIQWIMDRVIRTENFRWVDIATQLQYEKTFRSPGLTNLDGRITRAEVAYMLYKVYEWRY